MSTTSVTPPSVPAAWGWLRVLGILVARGYRAMLLTLVAVSVVPLLWGWGAVVVRTGSMEPVISPGDIAVTKTIGTDSKLPLGRVMVFENPARTDGELMIHRLVERRNDGSYTTAGDGNQFTDSTPVQRAGFQRQAVLLVPYVGRPVRWLQQGEFAQLVGWLVLTMGAFRLASRKLVDDADDEGGDDADAGESSVRRLPVRRAARLPIGRAGRHAAAPGRAAGVARAAVAGAVVLASLGVTAAALPSSSAAFTARSRNSANTFAVTSILSQPYTGAVKADGPEFLWLLDAMGGVIATDFTGNGRQGTYFGIDAYGQPGALPNNPGSSVRLGGGNDRIVEDGGSRQSPASYTVEMWFKTTDTGKLIGFENDRDTYSSRSDRTLFLDTSGRLAFGAAAGIGDQLVRSTRSYNDGGWHHVAVSVSTQSVLGIPYLSTATMYVDGAKIAQGQVTTPDIYSGWWRVGYGMLPSTFGYPGASITMNVDAVAVYNRPLTQSQVVNHWNKR
jgi:signal peptidase I